MSQDTNDKIGLSRRKVLAGLGAVGVASAGAGLGTTAYFNDTESFNNNTLTAGELDLKLDYKSTYLGGPGRLDDIEAMGYPDVEDLGDGRYLLDQAPSPADMQAWEDLVMEDDFDFCSPEADQYLVNGDGIPGFTSSSVNTGIPSPLTRYWSASGEQKSKSSSMTRSSHACMSAGLGAWSSRYRPSPRSSTSG